MAKLDQLQVREMLESYDSAGVTDNLYEMGKTLMDECSQRIDYLDAKTARIAGYTGAIIGLLVSTFPIWTSAIARWGIILIAIGSFVGMIGAAIALFSMWPAKFFLLSDSDWLEPDGLGDPDKLKRYYISSMHLTIGSQEKVTAQKSLAIKWSQLCLAVMVLTLFVGLGNATYRRVAATSKPSQQSSGRAALGSSSFEVQSPEPISSLETFAASASVVYLP